MGSYVRCKTRPQGSDAAGTFRVIYVAKFSDAVFILHCFQKKTQKTSKGIWNWLKADTAT
jgi:phage-related protein